MRTAFSAERYEDLYAVDGERELLDAIARNVSTYGVKEQYAGRMLEADLYAFWNTRGEASEAKKARKAQNKTVIENRNIRNTERKITHLVNTNFPTGSIEMYATFTDVPGSKKTAAQAMNWFIKKLRAIYKAAGKELRYLYIEEERGRDGDPIRYHYHIFLNTIEEISRDEIEDIWRGRYGIANSTRLVENEFGLTGMSVYVMKAPRSAKNQRRWACSRNLLQPEVRRSTRFPNRKCVTKKLMTDILENRVDAKEFFETAYAGYRFIDIRSKTSEYVGGVYVYVRMRRIDESDSRTPSVCAPTRTRAQQYKTRSKSRLLTESAGGLPYNEPDNRT